MHKLGDLPLVLRVWVELVMFGFIFRHFPNRASGRLVFRKPRLKGLNGSRVAQELRRRQLALSRAMRLLPGEPTCLTKAYVMRNALARAGIDSELKIGVASRDGAFVAHAWLVCGGVDVTGAQEFAEMGHR